MSNCISDESEKENLNNELNESWREIKTKKEKGKSLYKKDDDAMSIFSMQSNRSSFSFKDVSFSRRCSLPRLPTLAQLMQSGDMLKNVGKSIQRTCSFKNLHKINSANGSDENYNERSSCQNAEKSMNKVASSNKKRLSTIEKLHRVKGFKRKAMVSLDVDQRNIPYNTPPGSGSPSKIIKSTNSSYHDGSHVVEDKPSKTWESGIDSKSKESSGSVRTSRTSLRAREECSLINALVSTPFRKPKAQDSFQVLKNSKSISVCGGGDERKGGDDARDTNGKFKLSRGRRTVKKYWAENVTDEERTKYAGSQIKRQEAIYELYTGECDMVEDLSCLKTVYLESMKRFSLVKNEEVDPLLCSLSRIIPVHREMITEMEALRDTNKYVTNIGPTLYSWAPSLTSYTEYCANLAVLRTLLESKCKEDPRLKDFFARCQDSPFSRRLDIWSFIDLPRSRLVKYPLLFKQILKYTPESDQDYTLIKLSIKEVEKIITLIDKRMGHNKCVNIIESLEFLQERQKNPLIYDCQQLICSGILKNGKGVKLTAFLFDKLFVLTRPSSFNAKNPTKYRVHKCPIPLDRLILQDGDDGTCSGSTKAAAAPTDDHRVNQYSVPHIVEPDDFDAGVCHSDVRIILGDTPTPNRVTPDLRTRSPPIFMSNGADYSEALAVRTVPDTTPIENKVRTMLEVPPFAIPSTTPGRKSVSELRQLKIEGRITESSALGGDHDDGRGSGRNYPPLPDPHHKAGASNNNNTNIICNNHNGNALAYSSILSTNNGGGSGSKFNFYVHLCASPLNPHKVGNICIIESHTLYTHDVHDKKLWTDSIRSAIQAYNDSTGSTNAGDA